MLNAFAAGAGQHALVNAFGRAHGIGSQQQRVGVGRVVDGVGKAGVGFCNGGVEAVVVAAINNGINQKQAVFKKAAHKK